MCYTPRGLKHSSASPSLGLNPNMNSTQSEQIIISVHGNCGTVDVRNAFGEMLPLDFKPQSKTGQSIFLSTGSHPSQGLN
jgi:hypothetical protein